YLFGNDVIAGGPDDDVIFGGLGDDVIQGDGSLTLDPAQDPRAYRDATGLLVVRPSTPNRATDGDDYVEGGGGNDVIFGGLGQDDLIGGSSTQFGLGSSATLRPDGNDLIFGGAGQNDVIVGGWGADWIDGGSGDDGILGDDGRLYVSRVGTAEPLYGIGVDAQLNQIVSDPGNHHEAMINVIGELRYTADLVPDNLD